MDQHDYQDLAKKVLIEVLGSYFMEPVDIDYFDEDLDDDDGDDQDLIDN